MAWLETRVAGDGADGLGQEAAQGGLQRLFGRALEKRGRGGVEDGDALFAVDADDGVERGVDDGREPVLGQAQLLVALLQRPARFPAGRGGVPAGRGARSAAGPDR